MPIAVAQVHGERPVLPAIRGVPADSCERYQGYALACRYCIERLTWPMLPVPVVESLVCRSRYVAVPPPSVEMVVNCEAWQHFKSSFSRLCRYAVSLGMAEQSAGYDHRLLLGELRLMLFVHD